MKEKYYIIYAFDECWERLPMYDWKNENENNYKCNEDDSFTTHAEAFHVVQSKWKSLFRSKRIKIVTESEYIATIL
mgnify:CR=1 FL=1|jgi:hypothetical protein